MKALADVQFRTFLPIFWKFCEHLSNILKSVFFGLRLCRSDEVWLCTDQICLKHLSTSALKVGHVFRKKATHDMLLSMQLRESHLCLGIFSF